VNGVRQIQTRHRQTGRGAFTLTEILMAVGILGIGLTMVASVFPVAVDQSRQSRDATMAALCARSVAATIRARRFNIVDWYHRYSPPTSSDKDKPVEISFAVLPEAWTEYNPESFLYDQTIIDGTTTHDRVYNPTLIQPLWTAGNFVAIVFITPITSGGPYRLTIAVFKSRGPTSSVPRPVINKPYTYTGGTNPIVPGEYLYDTNALRGEAYRLDYINPPYGNVKLYPTLPAPADPSSGVLDNSDPAHPRYYLSPSSPRFYTLPGAVAVYHTIVGD
jgi:prepilin-type N-terminal cleavage/methylation domain-containing protein